MRLNRGGAGLEDVSLGIGFGLAYLLGLEYRPQLLGSLWIF